MSDHYTDRPNGYLETIERGIASMSELDLTLSRGIGTQAEQIARLQREIEDADAIVVGAGAGLSTAAGLTYDGQRFQRYFFDFAAKFEIEDMYSGGFYPFPDAETMWAWWARHIYFNRYIDAPKPVYSALLSLLEEKDYFVITTNVDHQFQRAGIDKKRLFYTQGDYGLFQSTDPRDRDTYANEEWTYRAMAAQGFVKDENGIFQVPTEGDIAMRIPSELLPTTPAGKPVTMNLRADDSFVEGEGWHKASAAYADFLRDHEKSHILYWEIGVGANTPIIIKYPFWAMTAANPKAVYASINYAEAICPKEIEGRSICIQGDAEEILKLFT